MYLPRWHSILNLPTTVNIRKEVLSTSCVGGILLGMGEATPPLPQGPYHPVEEETCDVVTAGEWVPWYERGVGQRRLCAPLAEWIWKRFMRTLELYLEGRVGIHQVPAEGILGKDVTPTLSHDAVKGHGDVTSRLHECLYWVTSLSRT